MGHYAIFATIHDEIELAVVGTASSPAVVVRLLLNSRAFEEVVGERASPELAAYSLTEEQYVAIQRPEGVVALLRDHRPIARYRIIQEAPANA